MAENDSEILAILGNISHSHNFAKFSVEDLCISLRRLKQEFNQDFETSNPFMPYGFLECCVQHSKLANVIHISTTYKHKIWRKYFYLTGLPIFSKEQCGNDSLAWLKGNWTQYGKRKTSAMNLMTSNVRSANFSIKLEQYCGKEQLLGLEDIKWFTNDDSTIQDVYSTGDIIMFGAEENSSIFTVPSRVWRCL